MAMVRLGQDTGTEDDSTSINPLGAGRGAAAVGLLSSAVTLGLAGTTVAVQLLRHSHDAVDALVVALMLIPAMLLGVGGVTCLQRQERARAGVLTRAAADRDRIAEELAALTAAHEELTRQQESLSQQQSLLRDRSHEGLVNLSMRTLTLVERQLALLENLEHGEQESKRLADLFQLDHLATRMRRHSENLLVVANADSRQTHHRPPVALLDVVRAAVSEIERFERVDVTPLPSARVGGQAADDLSHLLAEVLENATAYSAPDSRVEVVGWALEGGGLVLSVDDHGIGVPEDRLTEINEQIAGVQPEDAAAAAGGLGVFVVGRLAERHGVRVQLRARPGGGLSAVVSVPAALLDGPVPETGVRGTGTEASRVRPVLELTPPATENPVDEEPVPTPVPVPVPVPVPMDAPPSPVGRTGKGLPKRLTGDTPPSGTDTTALRALVAPGAATGPMDAEELRRRLSGFQAGLAAGRRSETGQEPKATNGRTGPPVEPQPKPVPDPAAGAAAEPLAGEHR